VLAEAARICAECLDVPFSKICQFQQAENDLLVVAGHGWQTGVVGFAISVADSSSPQGRAFTSGEPQVCGNVDETVSYTLPLFYGKHAIRSTADVLVAAKDGPPFGVLEVDSPLIDAFDDHDIDFLIGFANILAEAVATSERAENLRQTIVRMKELIEEKETLSQELKHRVRNSLHLVYGLLNAELDGDHPEDSIVAFRSIALRVMGLAEVFDHLLGIGMSKIINFGDYTKALCRNLPELYGQNHIDLICSVDEIHISLDDATALGIVITELVNNAYLHAFPDSVGTISVELTIAPGQATLAIVDDGVGYGAPASNRRGIGLVQRLVQQVDGTLTLESAHGTTWTIVWPVKDAPMAGKLQDPRP
jgi:two-component sensor histidine kinase